MIDSYHSKVEVNRIVVFNLLYTIIFFSKLSYVRFFFSTKRRIYIIVHLISDKRKLENIKYPI